MRILFVSTSSGSRGGGELYLHALGAALARNGVEVGLWASSHARMDELCNRFAQIGDVMRAPYVNTYDCLLRCLPLRGNWGQSWRIRRQWSEWKPDVIHLNKQNLEDGLDLMQILKGCAIPSVCTVHLTQLPSVLGARFSQLRDWFAARVLRSYRQPYICVSESRGSGLRSVCPDQNVVVIPNGVAIAKRDELARLRSDARNALGVRPEETLVISIGRFVEQKRPLQFLEKAIQIKKNCPLTKFLWLGGLPEADFVWLDKGTRWKGQDLEVEWNSRVHQAGLASSISLRPWDEKILPYLAAADWYFHTASYEGMPFTLLEAMSAGVPIAVTAALAKEVGFLNRENALFFEDDPDWSLLFSKTDRNDHRAETARKMVHSHYSIAQMARAYESLYHAQARSVDGSAEVNPHIIIPQPVSA